MKITQHPNATSVKLHNRRVSVIRKGDRYIVEFKRLPFKGETANCGRIVVAEVLITDEAAKALYVCLFNELTIRK